MDGGSRFADSLPSRSSMYRPAIHNKEGRANCCILWEPWEEIGVAPGSTDQAKPLAAAATPTHSLPSSPGPCIPCLVLAVSFASQPDRGHAANEALISPTAEDFLTLVPQVIVQPELSPHPCHLGQGLHPLLLYPATPGLGIEHISMRAHKHSCAGQEDTKLVHMLMPGEGDSVFAEYEVRRIHWSCDSIRKD